MSDYALPFGVGSDTYSHCEVDPPVDFEGVLTECWHGGQPKFRGRFDKDKLRQGPHICWWPNGTPREVSSWVQGSPYGVMLRFREDGSKEAELDYGEHGGAVGSFTHKQYSIDGELAFVDVWKSSELIAKWTRPDIVRMGEEIGVDELVRQAVKKMGLE